MAVAEPLPGFLAARESYLRLRGRHDAQERRLMELFQVRTLAELDAAMLASRNLHNEEVSKYNILSEAFDRAASTYDIVAMRQREKIRKQQAALHADIAAMDE